MSVIPKRLDLPSMTLELARNTVRLYVKDHNSTVHLICNSQLPQPLIRFVYAILPRCHELARMLGSRQCG
jgi:hypothetical protein